MGRIVFWLIGSILLYHTTVAQSEANVHQGEIGVTLGAAHYFGDLNNKASFQRPKPAVGLFFRKQFGNYVGLRLGFHFAQLGFADKYAENDFQRSRNLSFNSNIWEYTLQGDFNFFRFEPGNPDYPFTPYVTLGVGSMSFEPYAYLEGEKYFLRALATEGQGSAQYPERKQYRNTAMVYPLGMGIKYNISRSFNFHIEVGYRFTSTDYLDDVSTTYAGPTVFDPQSAAFLLQDRSYEVGPIIGNAGRQRGFNAQRDQFVIMEAGISVNLSSYRCPTPRSSGF